MPEVMAAIRATNHKAARMLEFTILTNVRTGSALSAKAEDFDWDKKIWTVPPLHLKDKKTRGTKPLRIPLSERAYEIALSFKPSRGKGLLFCHDNGLAHSGAYMRECLHRLNGKPPKWLDKNSEKKIVIHGFRATFQTWADETQSFPPDVIREAMGRVIGNQVDRVYSRGDLMEQRRPLMENWERCCFPTEAKVVSFPKGKKA
jgi:integrase